MSDIPMLLSDAEILNSIKSTMTRKQTMSLPLHLLKGNSSLDALENALRAESKFVSPAPSLRRRSMVSGSQARPCPVTLRAWSLFLCMVSLLLHLPEGTRASIWCLCCCTYLRAHEHLFDVHAVPTH